MACAAAVGLAGCGLTRTDVHQAIDQIDRQQVGVRYEVDYLAANRPFRLARLDSGGRTFDHLAPSQSLPDWTLKSAVCRLQLDYPGGIGARGQGRVQVWLDVSGERPTRTVRPSNMFMAILSAPLIPFQALFGASYTTTPEHTEHWRLSVTRSEVVDVLESLVAEGLFDRTYRAGSSAWVELRVNSRRGTAYWDPVPALDRLIERTRTSGELMSLNRSPDSPIQQLCQPRGASERPTR